MVKSMLLNITLLYWYRENKETNETHLSFFLLPNFYDAVRGMPKINKYVLQIFELYSERGDGEGKKVFGT
jgi:hypothetical protein